jgi:hypothetical protein
MIWLRSNGFPPDERYAQNASELSVLSFATSLPPGMLIIPVPDGFEAVLALIEVTSNFGFWTGVCDAAGSAAVANMGIRMMGFILFSHEDATSVTLK